MYLNTIIEDLIISLSILNRLNLIEFRCGHKNAAVNLKKQFQQKNEDRDQELKHNLNA